jgi:hypothetical protein
MTHGTWLSPGLQHLAAQPNIEGVNPIILQNLEYFAYNECPELHSKLRIVVRGPQGNLYA